MSLQRCHEVEHLIHSVEFIIARCSDKTYKNTVLDGGGVRNEKTADTQEHRLKADAAKETLPADGLTVGKNSTECRDYTNRTINTRRPKYNGTLLPERYIVDEIQTKTGIWLDFCPVPRFEAFRRKLNK